MWFLSLLWNTARALHPDEDIWGSVGVQNHSVIVLWTHKPPAGSFQECVLYTLYSRSESAVGITLVLSRCWTLTGLLSVCSYCLFFVCSFSGQYFSSVCRRCGSLTLLSSNLHLHVWGFGSFWIFFWCVREGGSESCTNLLLWRELSVKVKLVIYRSIHIPSSALGSDRNNELTDTSARKQFFVCRLLETGWGGAQSRATPPPH